MNIELKDLLPDGINIEGTTPGESLDLGSVGATSCSDVSYTFFVQEMDDELLVTGSVRADVGFGCVRCLTNFIKTIEERRFSVLTPIPEDSDAVDLTPDLREAIILNFPSYPKCAEDCAGLCAQCGKNLNANACTCHPPVDNQWGDLDKLSI